MSEYTEILFSVMKGTDGNLGIITLNRQEVLNSLNHEMIHALYQRLHQWAIDASIKAVVIKAALGRAFCAGGDIRLTYDRMLAKDSAAPIFFRDEYILNRFIFHYSKPYIALLDGITMGGGVGISIHGSHRIATEKLLFAMPETGIGFFPDVGGTYFLPRLPGKIGYYLGLTGARIKTDDAVATGIANHQVLHDDLEHLISALADESFGTNAKASVTEVIKRFETPVTSSTLLDQQAIIDNVFSGHTMEDIFKLLSESDERICQSALASLQKVSPTSLKITLRALQESRQFNFDEIMQREFRLSCRFLQGHDFPEGIRAVIIDKDQSPSWHPANLSGVTEAEVALYFSPLTDELPD